MASSIWNVGDSKTINFTSTEHVGLSAVDVEIAGFNLDYNNAALTSVSGITFLTKTLQASMFPWGKSNYNGSAVANNLNLAVDDIADESLKSALKTTYKWYANCLMNVPGQDPGYVYGSKLWVPREPEVSDPYGGFANQERNHGAQQYPIFNSDESRKRKDSTGVAKEYWTATPSSGNYYFCTVTENGTIDHADGGFDYLPFIFGFCV